MQSNQRIDMAGAVQSSAIFNDGDDGDGDGDDDDDHYVEQNDRSVTPNFRRTSEFQRQASAEVMNHSEMILQMVEQSDNDACVSSVSAKAVAASSSTHILPSTDVTNSDDADDNHVGNESTTIQAPSAVTDMQTNSTKSKKEEKKKKENKKSRPEQGDKGATITEKEGLPSSAGKKNQSRNNAHKDMAKIDDSDSFVFNKADCIEDSKVHPPPTLSRLTAIDLGGNSFPGAVRVAGTASNTNDDAEFDSENVSEQHGDVVVADAVSQVDLENQIRRNLLDEVRREFMATAVPATCVERDEHSAKLDKIATMHSNTNREDEGVNPRAKQRFSSRTRRLLLRGLVIGVIFSVVMIGLIAFLIVRTLGVKPTTTSSPEHHQELWDLLVLHSPDRGRALKLSTSPQYQAFRWLEQDPSVTSVLNHRGLQGQIQPREEIRNNRPPPLNRPQPSLQETEWLERYAMATLFFSTGGDTSRISDDNSRSSISGWFKSDGWLSDVSICDWFTKADESVSPCEADKMIRLDLHSNGLAGTLPNELTLLRTLRFINLADNQLKGGIFPAIGTFQNLRRFELQNNKLEGTIPPELGFMTKTLQEVNLENNQLTGLIPKEIANLDAMIVLRLGENKLQGYLQFDLQNVEFLEVLDVHGNNFTPTNFSTIAGWLQELKVLKILNLSNTGLFGPVPSELSQLNTLVTIDVRNNSLTGTIPLDYSAWLSIENIYLDGNSITGVFPSEVCELVHMNSANLSADCDDIDCDCCTHCCDEDSICHFVP